MMIFFPKTFSHSDEQRWLYERFDINGSYPTTRGNRMILKSRTQNITWVTLIPYTHTIEYKQG